MKSLTLKISLFFCAYAIAITCFAQQEVIRTHTVKDGLVMNRVRGFYQDSSGFIWIYTWDGLSRYEGNNFRNYVAGNDLSHGLINDMIELPDGRVYVALNNGTIDVIDHLEVQPRLRQHGPIINVFFRDYEGRVYAGTDFDGLCTFDNGTITPLSGIQSHIIILHALIDKDLLFVVRNDLFQVYKIKHGYPDNLISDLQLLKEWRNSNDYYQYVFRDNFGRILIGTSDGLKQIVFASEGDDGYYLELPDFIEPNMPWRNWKVLTITQTRDGTYWIGTENGLVKFVNSKNWIILNSRDNLPSDQITSLMIDRSDILWIGTDLGAASINLVNKISRFNSSIGQNINYLLPVENNMMLCIARNDAIHLFDSSGSIIKNHPATDALGLIHQNSELKVISTDSMENMGKNWPDKVRNPLPFSTKFLAESKDNIYWLSVKGFNCCPNLKTCRQVSGINKRTETLTEFADNKLLVGTWDEGLFIASFEDHEPCQLKVIHDLSRWLPGKEIRSLMVSSTGDIWVGTRYHGLIRMRCSPSFAMCESDVFNISNGLISNWISAIAEDYDGNIWVGSISGLDKIIPESDNFRVFSFSRVFDFYGIVHHIAVSIDNSIWCNSSTGLSRISDGKIHTQSPPRAYITEAILGGENQASHTSSIISLPFDKNSANFSFSAPDYRSDAQLQFTYRLSGTPDTAWSPPGIYHQIFYGNLQPGSYQFEVAALGWNGERGPAALFPFKINPPFWRTLWFMTFLVLLVASLLYAIYKFRIAQMQRLQVIRDRIASDLHDDIGSSLSHVNILSELGKQELLKSEKPLDILERIGIEAQYSSEALDDIIWSVKSKSDVIGNVIARMRQYATELFESSSIEFYIKEDITVDHPLNMEFRRDLYLAYKEILRNIVRHAHATRVEIDILISQDLVSLSILDNGKGFDVHKPTLRSGILNIKERVSRWKGYAEWDSIPGKGSRVTVVMKQK